jgi:hypothetical protein
MHLKLKCLFDLTPNGLRPFFSLCSRTPKERGVLDLTMHSIFYLVLNFVVLQFYLYKKASRN